MKMNPVDATTRAFRFQFYEDGQRAMAIAMASDRAISGELVGVNLSAD